VRQMDYNLVSIVTEIGGYKEIIVNYARMYGLTGDEQHIKNITGIAVAMIQAEEKMHNYLQGKRN